MTLCASDKHGFYIFIILPYIARPLSNLDVPRPDKQPTHHHDHQHRHLLLKQEATLLFYVQCLSVRPLRFRLVLVECM